MRDHGTEGTREPADTGARRSWESTPAAAAGDSAWLGRGAGQGAPPPAMPAPPPEPEPRPFANPGVASPFAAAASEPAYEELAFGAPPASPPLDREPG